MPRVEAGCSKSLQDDRLLALLSMNGLTGLSSKSNGVGGQIAPNQEVLSMLATVSCQFVALMRQIATDCQRLDKLGCLWVIESLFLWVI